MRQAGNPRTRCRQMLWIHLGLCLLGLWRVDLSLAAEQFVFDVPEGSAAEQLLLLVHQAHDPPILLPGDLLKNVHTHVVRGTMDLDSALALALIGTGLDFYRNATGTIMLRRSADTPEPPVQGGSGKRSAHKKTTQTPEQSVPLYSAPLSDNEELDNVVITGSRIKDKKAADSTPQRVYDQDALERSGAATLAEFSQIVPENFNSVSPLSSLFGNTVGAPQLGNNPFLGTGFNLSGLGPEATLTLLDGDRWVSGGASGAFLDLSLLPLNAVAGVVTLTGDTSAVYGSDAIAGVVNILSASGADGNEIRVRYGTTSDGGGGQWVFSQRLGGVWQGGDGMIAYQHTQQSPILSTARNYIPAPSPAVDIVPQQSSSGLLGKLDHEFTQGTSVTLHFLYGARDVRADSSGFGGYLLTRDSPAQEYGGTVHIDQRLTPQWTVGLYGSYSTLKQSLTASASGVPPQGQPGDSALGELALSTNAQPFEMFGQPVNVAFGAGGRKETLTVPTSLFHTSYTSLERKVGDAYVETLLPLASGSHTLVKRLELSLVAREDYYEAVGPTLNPKAGLVWSPVSDLNFRGTFASSFRPPSLDELAAIPLYYTVNVPDPASITGVTDTLVNQSQGISRLKPETARTFTAGLDYRRDSSQGWTGSATWFQTVFDDRVAAPLAGTVGPTTDIFAQPALAPYISRSIDPARVQAIFASPAFALDSAGAGPTGVMAMFDNELTNIARTLEQGVEASLRYSTGEKPRQFDAYVIANYLLCDTYRPTPAAPTISLVNNVGQPPNLRTRGGVTWSRNDWRTTLNVNYTDGYHNTLRFPVEAVHSWTTLDFQLAGHLSVVTGPLQNVQLTFNARNISNTAPPRVAVPAGLALRPVGFDAANASPFGRMLSLEFSVAW